MSKRDFVMLGLTHKCKGCGAWAGLISAPLMLVSDFGLEDLANLKRLPA